MTFDFAFARAILPAIAEGLLVSLEASLAASLLAFTLGLACALVLRGAPIWVRVCLGQLLGFIRNTPLLVQLYVWYYALPSLGLSLDAFPAGVLGLGLHYTPYLAEVYRSGIDAVPRGQWEAAQVLGLSRSRTWASVIIPQALPPLLPNLGNYVIALFKDTPMLAAITVMEALSAGLLTGARSFRYLEPLTVVGVLFLITSLLATWALTRLEKYHAR